MKVLKMVLAVVLFLMALFFLIFSIAAFSDSTIGPVAGVIFLIIGVFFIILSIKLRKKTEEQKAADKLRKQESAEKAAAQKKQKQELAESKKTEKQKAAEEADKLLKQKKAEKSQKAEAGNLESPHKSTADDNTVFIEYQDVNGNFTSRTIEIKDVYKKSGKLYVLAYCFMKGEDRTFLVERISGIRTKRGGKDIKDIKYIKKFFLDKKMNKPTSASAEDLAAEALSEE